MVASGAEARGAAAGQGRSGRWALALKLLVSLGLLALIAQSVDLGGIGDMVLALTPAWAAAAVLSLTAISLVSAVRWWLVIAAIGTRQPLGRVLYLMFIGSFFTQMLPTSIGGDALRIWQLSRFGVAMNRAFIGVMLERISGLIALVFMVAGGVFWLGEALSPTALRYVLLATLPSLLLGLVLLCCLDGLPPSLWKLPLLGRVLKLLAEMAADARRIVLSPGLSLILLVLSATAQLLTILAFYFFARALGLDLGLFAIAAVAPAIILIVFLPISFAGWGVREGASIAMFAAVGLGADQAVVLSVLFGLGLILAGIPGLVFWLRATPAQVR